MTNLKDLVQLGTPFADFDITDDDYMKFETLKGKQIEIIKTESCMSQQNGKGIRILFRLGDELHYTTSFAVRILDILGSENVIEAIANGETITCTVVERPSRKSGNLMYDLQRDRIPSLETFYF